jgi:hypothetical protein
MVHTIIFSSGVAGAGMSAGMIAAMTAKLQEELFDMKKE